MRRAQLGRSPNGDRTSFAAPSGDRPLPPAPGTKQMRALATNGNIRLPFTVKETQWAHAQRRRGGATVDAPHAITWGKIVDEHCDLQKHCLWRHVTNTKVLYSCDFSHGQDSVDREDDRRELIGVIEQVRISGKCIRFHVIVRGVVSMPMWWFTREEFQARVHHLFGPTYVQPLFANYGQNAGRRQGHFLSDARDRYGDEGSVEADYIASLEGKRAKLSRHKMVQVNCFFRV